MRLGIQLGGYVVCHLVVEEGGSMRQRGGGLTLEVCSGEAVFLQVGGSQLY